MRLDKQIAQEHKIKDANKKCNKVFLGFWNNRTENKCRKRQIGKQYVKRIDPGAIDFTSGFSQENSTRWVNKLLLGG